MKSRLFWAALVLAAVAGFYFTTIRPALNPPARKLRLPKMGEFRPPEITLPSLPTPTMEMPTLAPPPLPTPTPIMRPAERLGEKQEVPIQDGATIDFSFGAPMVKSQGKDAEALEKALKEMAEATKNVEFSRKK